MLECLNDPCSSPHSKCEAYRPVASLPSFSNARSLEYANFILQAKERCERGYGRVWKRIRVIATLRELSVPLLRKISITHGEPHTTPIMRRDDASYCVMYEVRYRWRRNLFHNQQITLIFISHITRYLRNPKTEDD